MEFHIITIVILLYKIDVLRLEDQRVTLNDDLITKKIKWNDIFLTRPTVVDIGYIDAH